MTASKINSSQKYRLQLTGDLDLIKVFNFNIAARDSYYNPSPNAGGHVTCKRGSNSGHQEATPFRSKSGDGSEQSYL